MSTPKPPPPPVKLPQCLSIKQLMARTGLGRTLISQALSRGEIEHFRIGGRAVIPEDAAVAWLESHRIRSHRRIGRRNYTTTPTP